MLCEVPGTKSRGALMESEAFNGRALETAYLNLNTLVSIVKTYASPGRIEETGYGARIYRKIKEEIL